MRRLLLCTDLDRTLIPNGRAPESPQARRLFAKLAACPQVTLAYVTGRHQALIQQAMLDYDLPTPAFAIADVGATLYQVRSGQWQRWTAWDDHLAPDWGDTSHTELCQLLRGISALTLQEPHKQARHKLSFYAPMQTEPQALLAQIGPILRRHGVRANLIWSLDEATQQGLLDILPGCANKLHAIKFLMAAQGFDHDCTVFAGDSGNDLEVFQSNIPSVLVANADADIRRRVTAESPDRLYLARGDFLGMNGNYSAGILEGVAHHHPDIADWLHQQR